MASISIRCPSCSATEGVVRNGKSTAGHQRWICPYISRHLLSLNPLQA
ncbi:IS1 family transposase, partial [Escherichia coli]